MIRIKTIEKWSNASDEFLYWNSPVQILKHQKDGAVPDCQVTDSTLLPCEASEDYQFI